MTRKKQSMERTELLVLIAMSLGTEELRVGLDAILFLALEHATEFEDWDSLNSFGDDSGQPRFSEYEVACIRAAHAWIKRVTTFDEFERARIIQKRDEKKP